MVDSFFSGDRSLVFESHGLCRFAGHGQVIVTFSGQGVLRIFCSFASSKAGCEADWNEIDDFLSKVELNLNNQFGFSTEGASLELHCSANFFGKHVALPPCEWQGLIPLREALRM